MPRTKRLHYDGAICHVFNRGHDKAILFRDTEDYAHFRNIVRTYLKKFSLKIYNYCLMPTHYHFLVRIEQAKEMAYFMKGVAQTYANYFKEKYPHAGYLFQNRYKSILIEKEDYLLECARYIERNPVRAKIVNDPSEYKWSSYNYYAKGSYDDIITPNLMYESFGRTAEERRKYYIEYIRQARPYETVLDDAIAKLK